MRAIMPLAFLLLSVLGAARPVESAEFAGPLRPQKPDTVFERAAARYGLDPDMLRAIAYQETGCRHYRRGSVIRGRSGEVGMMQVMPYHVTERFRGRVRGPVIYLSSAANNVDMAAWYLQGAIRRSRTLYEAFSRYNRGWYARRVNHEYARGVMAAYVDIKRGGRRYLIRGCAK